MINKETGRMEVEVVEVRKAYAPGLVKAYASVKFGGSIIVRAFTVVEGKKGLFVKLPAKLSRDGLFTDVVAIDEYLRQDVESAVLEAYGREE